MMHRLGHLVLLFALVGGTRVQAQVEQLRALSARPVPHPAQVKSDLNTYFIYEYQSQGLPIMDDFSVDRTLKRWATPDDPDVSLSATAYRLEVAGVSSPDMAFSSDTTFRYLIDISDPDTTIVNSEPLPVVQIIVRDLSMVPPAEEIVDAWPPYNVFDTLQVPPADTLWLVPDLVQDSLLIYTVSADTREYLMNSVSTPFILWADDDVHVNGTYPLNPPTVGVATFDGLARDGLPYNFEQYSSYGIADRLTSVPINMLGPAADSIYLSFHYQARGLSGDAFPQPQDSLALEFYAPQEQVWYRVWSIPYPSGQDVQPFQQVMIPIKEFRYLQNGFRMRFLNYATLSGSFDHWHLDYVRLGRQRTFDDTTLVDTGWLYPEASILETYTSVPLSKYQQAPASYMTNEVSILQRNLDDEDRFITWRMQVADDDDAVVFDPPTYGNNTFDNAHTIFPSLHPINAAPNNFVYDPLPGADDAFWKVRFITNATPDINRYNDTISFVQELSNYYAYDDGSAEMGYWLNAAGAKLAYRFDMVGGDSLRAVRMYFNPIANEPPLPMPDDGIFLVTVWSSLDPEVIVHQNFSFSSPQYRDHGLNKFIEYPLDSTIWVQGSFYVGWVQTNPVRMNLGFDRNRNNQNKIFFKVGNNWQNTTFQGSLMMRPVLVSGSDPWVGLEEPVPALGEMALHPNPAADRFSIRLQAASEVAAAVQLLDGMGRVVRVEPWRMGSYSTADLPGGIYLVRVLDHTGTPIGHSRLIIQQ